MNFKLTKSSGAHHVRKPLNPRRDWFVLLGIASVLLLVSIAGNLWYFNLAMQDRTIGDGVLNGEEQALNLDSTRALFSERAAERARYVDGYGFTDPSR